MFTLLRKRRPTGSGVQAGPSSLKKQRFIDGTKILLDVAKESADAFPPLKSCLGGIGALIKHYEESKDVEDKLEDLIPWLTKLRGSVNTVHPNDNREDVERREQLARSLEEIEKRSLELMGKGKAVKILDKKQDSGMVIKLVEELRQAILIYQLSQQRSIDNQVAQLASSFSAFVKLHEKQRGIRSKVESILERLGKLEAETNTGMMDQDEFKQRIILFEALEGIKDSLVLILKRSSANGYKENLADAHTVCELADNLRDAIMDYQFARQKAVDERAVLNSYRRAQGAGYQHGDRNGCLKGTRESVLDEIERWTEDSKESPVFWLNGLAGTGKTTIAQTIAERVFAKGQLGASFFCSRDFEDRSNLRFVFPTLAFQLAHRYSDFRSHLVSLLRTNPDVVHESLYNQMKKLIAEPLRTAGVSTVIVIDALDECKDDEPSSAILSVLGRFVGLIPEAKFLITGRPEPRIRTGFRLPLLIDSTDVFVLHDVHPSFVNSDIRLFLEHELSGLAQRRQLGRWPTDESINVLCHRAAGLFVYAVATVKFLDGNTHLPKHRLDAIMKLPESTVPEGKTWFKPKTTLDSLYTSILQAAFSEEDPFVDFKVRAAVGAIVGVVNPLPPRAIAELIGVEPEEVILFLTLIQSLLAISEDSDQPVKPFHKSFPDFITDLSRCTDERFFINPGYLHFQLAMNCLRVMNEWLEQDLLSLPKYTMNSEVRDLQTRINNRVSTALQYACRSWHSHLIEIKEDIPDLISCLRTFLEEKFLAWLEVLSVLGDVGGAVAGLDKLMPWLRKVAKYERLLNTVRDCFYFVTKFFEPISASATHIYHSALELCPTSSIVRKLYYQRSSRITYLPRVVVGTPDSWDQTISVSGKDDYVFCTWSPCGRFVAALTGNTVEIRNKLTLELLTTLQPTETTPLLTGPLAYSPDGRSLGCASNSSIVIWDIQTGGAAKEIVCGTNTISLAWSSDGRTICTLNSLHQDIGDTVTLVNTYDVSSGTPLLTETVRSSHKPHLWTLKESFQIMTTKQYPPDSAEVEIGINFLEVRSPLATISTFNIKTRTPTDGTSTEYTPGSEIVSCSPTTRHVSIVVGDKLLIFKRGRSLPLLEVNGRFLSLCFPSSGNLFAASTEYDIYIWKYISSRYVRQRGFRHQGWIKISQFSPASSSFMSLSGNILQMQHLTDLSTIPEFRRRQYAVLSPSGTIATTYGLESIITVITPCSKAPPQLINTGVVIEGLFLTGNVLLVMGSEKVLSWRLAEEGLVEGVIGDRIPNYSDCLWTIPLPFSSHEPKFEVEVEGQTGVINYNGNTYLLYHTSTGKILEPSQEPLCPSGPGYDPRDGLCGRHYLRYHNLSQRNTPLVGGWCPSEATLREGWVTDPEGRHRLWLDVGWRRFWDLADWCHDITTQSSIIGGQSVVVKF